MPSARARARARCAPLALAGWLVAAVASAVRALRAGCGPRPRRPCSATPWPCPRTRHSPTRAVTASPSRPMGRASCTWATGRRIAAVAPQPEPVARRPRFPAATARRFRSSRPTARASVTSSRETPRCASSPSRGRRLSRSPTRAWALMARPGARTASSTSTGSPAAAPPGWCVSPRAAASVLEQVTTVDTVKGERDHFWPSALPGGRGILFTIQKAGNDERNELAVLDTKTMKYHTLVQALTGRYSASGHLLYVTATGDLLAMPFSLDRLEVSGEPFAVTGSIKRRPFGAVDLALSTYRHPDVHHRHRRTGAERDRVREPRRLQHRHRFRAQGRFPDRSPSRPMVAGSRSARWMGRSSRSG